MEIKQKKSISIDELISLENKDHTKYNVDSSKNEVKEKTPNDRYYLPVLNINRAEEWPSKPLNERKHFTDKVAMEACLGNCCGVEGLKGGCCHLDPFDLEHVLGPLEEDWIKDIIKCFRNKGLNFNRQDIVIDNEEGKIIGETLFRETNNNNIFQHKDAYPILRFQVIGPRYACKFMSPMTYKCQIYEKRPNMCSNYLCQWVITNFLVKTKDKPNTWQKVG